jgi:hypothetical protein
VTRHVDRFDGLDTRRIVRPGTPRFVEELDESSLVETQIGGVGPNDTALIRKGREVIECFVFEGGEVVPVDSNFLLGLAESYPLLSTGLSQGIAEDGHGGMKS